MLSSSALSRESGIGSSIPSFFVITLSKHEKSEFLESPLLAGLSKGSSLSLSILTKSSSP
jgi:hypothetical protein